MNLLKTKTLNKSLFYNNNSNLKLKSSKKVCFNINFRTNTMKWDHPWLILSNYYFLKTLFKDPNPLDFPCSPVIKNFFIRWMEVNNSKTNFHSKTFRYSFPWTIINIVIWNLILKRDLINYKNNKKLLRIRKTICVLCT